MALSSPAGPDDASALSVKSGVEGPYAGGADAPLLGAAPSSSTPAAAQ
jgi:hypothetical protein